ICAALVVLVHQGPATVVRRHVAIDSDRREWAGPVGVEQLDAALRRGLCGQELLAALRPARDPIAAETVVAMARSRSAGLRTGRVGTAAAVVRQAEECRRVRRDDLACVAAWRSRIAGGTSPRERNVLVMIARVEARRASEETARSERQRAH